MEEKYKQKYGFAVFSLDFKESKNGLIISGRVLTEKQKSETEEGAKKIYKGAIENRIKTLSDSRSKELGWAIVKKDLIDLRSRFVDSSVINDKILKKVRASQSVKGEILRVLMKQDDQLLVQQGDLTMGWVGREDVILKRISLRKGWGKGIFVKPGELIAIKEPRKKLILEAERFLGVKYVLGAKSEKAIDCSGLTQLVYKNAFDVILPRHSWDQRKMGVVIDSEDVETGDLIFMTNKKTNIKHVGILEIAADNMKNIIHASVGSGGVARQDFGEVAANYNILEIRRMIKK
ncbi:MAG: C40 family peptidase [Candidatus Pacebacteria bacterium]|nr:C40 family peptidase [Candidatus Paceibacterota bacterium]